MHPTLRFGPLVPSTPGQFGPRRTIHYELVMVGRGWTRPSINGVPREPIGPAAVALLLPGQEVVHEFDADAAEQMEGWWVHVPPELVPPRLAERLHAAPRVIPMSAHIHRVLAALMQLKSVGHSTVQQMAELAGVELLWCYVGDAEVASSRQRRGGKPDPVAQAQAFIREHLHEPLRLDDLACAAGSSRTHAVRLFRASVGETPMAHLWRCRIDRAVELLEETGLSVGQIAERTGFRTTYHFSRSIRRRLGLTPTELRRRAWRAMDEPSPRRPGRTPRANGPQGHNVGAPAIAADRPEA